MTKQQQITNFLNGYVKAWPRSNGPWRQNLHPYRGQNARPSAEAVAKEFLGVPEFRVLQLGTWLGTTDGEILSEAVEMVVPMFFAEDAALLVEALKVAAALQQREGKTKALLTAFGTAAFVGIATRWGRAA